MADSGTRAMKDGLGTEAIGRIARSLAPAFAAFDRSSFEEDASAGLEGLELKARVVHIADVLYEHLPADFGAVLAGLVRARPGWDYGRDDDNVSGFAAWPILHLVGKHGVSEAYFEASLETLRQLTGLFTSEFAVRPFLLADQARALETMRGWLDDTDDAVRRLVSEGTRPRLPWAPRLPALMVDPSPALELLERLKDDPSLYVRRSVANHLNDLAKDHPDLVVEICSRWLEGASDERQWVVRHGTRTLVKQGHPRVWSLLGYTQDPQVSVDGLTLGVATLALGGSLNLEFNLRSHSAESQSMVVDYAVHHMKANGSLSPKVFKLKTVTLGAGNSVVIQKRHTIKPISTRRYYAGLHWVEVLVNGVPKAAVEFELEVPRVDA